jgi:hypothetical protein
MCLCEHAQGQDGLHMAGDLRTYDEETKFQSLSLL